ncbi:prolyl 4-hydroxylase subunit alpha-1 [Plutella xylostella]|uniref:prolyl 4-hydroxylase subunit alpha-1 n=1 Tax=Plutella xylostella TaxID=51655 RepID=UPI002032CABD|nr:prolyl 4-hydroxylase subunit alpha-1 [Plutella xylostella]
MIPRNMNIVGVFAFALMLGQSWDTSAELFTAISDVEYLLETHKKIIDDLDLYIEKEERRLGKLKRDLTLYKLEHEKAMEDIPNYLGNPINAFTLIKRLTSDLDTVEKNIKMGTEYIKNITSNRPGVKYPTNEDLTGAAQALTRLQTTYHLDTRDLSEGILNGVSYSTPMSTSDCYELGRALYSMKDYKNALGWMMEALRKYREDEELSFTKIDIIEYIGFAHYLLDDVKSAMEWTKRLLELDPEHDRALGNVPHYEKSLAEEKHNLNKKRRGETGEDEEEANKPKKVSGYLQERKNYEALCRGEMDIPAHIAMRLKCWYTTDNHPFLRLAAIKTEQMYIKPDIFIFYDVMSDAEIEHIKDMARPRFKRAVVHDPATGELVPAHYRISKSSWLKDEEHPIVERISRRVTHMTQLDMRSAEELQVVNYGIGGHYEPHYDFARKRENAFVNFPGNRIATVLFYMSDVAQGGATVFTELGLSLSPVKRAAAFWLNLHPSGEGDLATRHAACPVLRGSKWVSNKWIHQGGQELIKPCGTEYQEEGYIHKVAKPVPKTSR